MLSGGVCPGGILSGGDIVRGILSGGYCPDTISTLFRVSP